MIIWTFPAIHQWMDPEDVSVGISTVESLLATSQAFILAMIRLYFSSKLSTPQYTWPCFRGRNVASSFVTIEATDRTRLLGIVAVWLLQRIRASIINKLHSRLRDGRSPALNT